MPDNIGTFELRDSGGTRVSFFPILPGTTVAQANPPNPLAPGDEPNPINVGRFGVMDIVVLIPDGAPIARTAVATTGLTQAISGAAVNRGTLFTATTGGHIAHLCFAFDVGWAATSFAGSLRVTCQVGGTATRLDIPVEIQQGAEENDLVIAFALIATRRNYTWIKLEVLNRNGNAAVANAAARIRPLRDNTTTARSFNRFCDATTTATGFLAHGERDVVGVPIDWPVVFEFEAPTFVRRAHMLEFAAAQRTGHENNNPHVPTSVLMDATTDASLATRHFAFDPGHGVVYAATAQRRSQEWFLAHRIATGIADILQSRHGVPAANIHFMRTAGLSISDPDRIDRVGGPEEGDQRYEYDMAARTIRIRQAARNLTDLSNVLLTTHDDVPPFASHPVPVLDRNIVLTSSAATITAAITRSVAAMTGRTAVAGSERWDTTTDRYVFDTIATGAAATPPPPTTTHNISIDTTDLFTVTDAMLMTLAARTARWSLNREVSGQSAFKTAARNAMIAQGALRYMTDAVFEEADHPAGHDFVSHGVKGWSFGGRRDRLRALAPAPDITLTLHHNALGTDGDPARGNVMLASNAASATEAHLRLQKTFVKYVRGLKMGLRSRGIVNDHSSALNGAANASLIPGYAFFENEFMNAGSPVAGLDFEYERMVLPAFVDRTVEEIVAGIVEFLLNPQPNTDFDPVDLGVGLTEGPVRW